MLRELPKLQLSGQCLWIDFPSWFAMYDKTSLPLSFRNIPDSDAPLWRNCHLNSTKMRLHSSVRYHCSSINTKLDHMKAVLNQELAKDRVLFSFLLFFGWKVECQDHPTHFKFGGVHGLYSLTACLRTAFRKLRITLSMQLLIVISI